MASKKSLLRCFICHKKCHLKEQNAQREQDELLEEMSRTFFKYWILIELGKFPGFNLGDTFPFCARCKGKVNKVYRLHVQMQGLKEKIRKMMTNVTATLILTSSSGTAGTKKKVSKGSPVADRIEAMRSLGVQRYLPAVILRPLNKTRSPKTLRRLKPSKRGLDTPFTGELENQSPSRRVFDGSYNADTEGGRDCSNLVEEISGGSSGRHSDVTSASGSPSSSRSVSKNNNSSDSENSDDDVVILDEVARKRVSRAVSRNQNKPRKNTILPTNARRRGRPPKIRKAVEEPNHLPQTPTPAARVGLPCKECGQRFASTFLLREHRFNHSDARLKCSHCGEKFKSRIQYISHRKGCPHKNQEIKATDLPPVDVAMSSI